MHVRPAAGEEPHVVFAPNEFNYGIVEAGSTTPTTFKFKNDGKGPLKILQVRPACGCVTSGVDVEGKPYLLGAPIAPGSSGEIHANIQALWTKGDKHTFLDILTNDPAFGPTAEAPFGHTKLHLYASIVRWLEFETEAGAPLPETGLDLGVLPNTTETRASVFLRNTKDEPFAIASVDPKDPAVRVASSPANDKKSRWRVDLTIPPGAPLGKLQRAFDFQLEPKAPNTKLYILGNICGNIEVDPPLVTGLRLPMGFGIKGDTRITLKDRAKEPLKIQNIRLCEPGDFKLIGGRNVPLPGKPPGSAPRAVARIIADNLVIIPKEVEAGKTWTLDVTVKPTMPRGFFHVMLVFETGVPDGPAEIAIPIYGNGPVR
jgi:hypothetical protein